jgi:hypothetical protein
MTGIMKKNLVKNNLLGRRHPFSCGLIAAFALGAFVTHGFAAAYMWNFDAGDLTAAYGNGELVYFHADTEGVTGFGSTGGAIPNINGQTANYMYVPAFGPTNFGYQLWLHDSGPNGGDPDYIRQYTIIFDVYVPEPLNWLPFFNTNPWNKNDAEFYLRNNGSIGLDPGAGGNTGTGYSPGGVVAANTWHRIAFAADFEAGTVAYYVDGQQVHYKDNLTAAVRSKYSLYSNVPDNEGEDPYPSFALFNNNYPNQYKHELYVNSIAVADWTLSPEEMAGLGGANAAGILIPEPSSLALAALGLVTLLGFRRLR